MRIYILAFWLFSQFFFGGQQVQEKPRPLAANIVFQSLDGGQSWQDVSAGLPEDLQVGRVFAGGWEVFLLSDSGLYRSSAAFPAPTWEKEVLLSKTISDIFPGRAGRYAFSNENGLLLQLPGTGIWAPVHSALKGKTVRTLLETSDRTIFAGCDSGLFKSADGGETWEKVLAEGTITSLVDADGVLVGGGFRGLLRSTDGGKTWERMDKSFPLAQNIYDLEKAGKYLFCSLKAGIFRSSDRGKTWELVRPSYGEGRFDLAVSGQTVFAVMVAGMGDGC